MSMRWQWVYILSRAVGECLMSSAITMTTVNWAIMCWNVYRKGEVSHSYGKPHDVALVMRVTSNFT